MSRSNSTSSGCINLHCPSCDKILREISEDHLILDDNVERTLLPKVCHHCSACINSTTTQPHRGNKSMKRAREDFLRNDDFFMALAFLYAGRYSKPDLQIGACLVNNSNCLVDLFAVNSLQELDDRLEELSPQSGKLYLTVKPNKTTIDALERSSIDAVFFIPHDRILTIVTNNSSQTKCRQFIPKRISRIVIQPHESNKLNNAPDYQVPFYKYIEDDKSTDDKFFIALAYLIGMRSEDPSKQVGSCIVDETVKPAKVVSIGYSHMERRGRSYDRENNKKWNSIIFGEIDAINNAKSRKLDSNNCTIYTTIFPGDRSAEAIKEASYISHVVYTPTGKLLQESFKTSREKSEEIFSKHLHCRPFYHRGSILATINLFVNRKPHILRHDYT